MNDFMDAYELNDAWYRMDTYMKDIDMAMTPEKRVKNDVRKILDEYEAYYFFPATGGFGRSGVPDVVACFKGRFIGIECKAGTNEPTALQIRELTRIKEHGGDSLVINEGNLQDLRDVLEGLANE